MNATSALKLRRAWQAQDACTCMGALKNGGTATRLSALVMGLGNMVHGQVAKGLLFLAAEIAYLVFMFTNGFHNLAMLVSLGSVEQQEYWNEELQIFEYTQGDQSILLLWPPCCSPASCSGSGGAPSRAPTAPNACPKPASTSIPSPRI